MAREPRVGEIEAPPPEVDGARLTDEAAAEHLQNPFDLDEQLPACPSRCGIVRAVDGVGFEANGVGDFDRHGPDPGADVQPCQRVHDAARSEEHTSELQSLAYLVCRLLLEKKKTTCTSDLSHVGDAR